MLKSPDKTVNVNDLLTLADLLDQSPADWNMSDWRHCIAGQCSKLFAGVAPVQYDEGQLAADYLGLNADQRYTLFATTGFVAGKTGLRSCKTVTAKEAARVVRHLALTGEVDWGVANEQ